MLNKILWLWVPLLVLISKIGIELYLEHEHIDWLVGENGPYETLEAVVLVIALLIALYTLVKMPKDNKWLVGWVSLAALCCFYVAGEEISWGQHIMNWGTPEYWLALNDQGETNFHNTTSWLDQKPRLLLSIGVYIGGLILPLMFIFKSKLLEKPALKRFEILYPTQQFMVVAGICLFIKIADKIADITDLQLFARNAESEELFLFYFVLLYLLLMKKRLVSAKK
jgi:hypothetical protein